MGKVVVSIVMGSDSDLPVMLAAADMLEQFNVGYELDIVSAHRTPEKLFEYSKNAHKRGIQVIIAGAGGAAHLPGMIASLSPLPIIGVPVKSSNSIDGWDSILSILQSFSYRIQRHSFCCSMFHISNPLCDRAKSVLTC